MLRKSSLALPIRGKCAKWIVGCAILSLPYFALDTLSDIWRRRKSGGTLEEMDFISENKDDTPSDSDGEPLDMASRKLQSRVHFWDRLRILERACAAREDSQEDPPPVRYFEGQNWWYSSKHNFLYCMGLKAASSTMTSHFSVLAFGEDLHPRPKVYNNRTYDFRRVSEARQKDILATYQNPVTFVFATVRHPFSRIVSEYNHRVYAHPCSPWAPELQEAGAKLCEATPPSPAELVRYLYSRRPGAYRNVVTFVPLSYQCDFCVTQFDAIMTVDTFPKDLDYVANALGIQDKINLTSHENKIESGDDPEKEFFSQVPLEDLEKLYEYHKQDFTMFGYSPEKYFRMAKSN